MGGAAFSAWVVVGLGLGGGGFWCMGGGVFSAWVVVRLVHGWWCVWDLVVVCLGYGVRAEWTRLKIMCCVRSCWIQTRSSELKQMHAQLFK